MDIKYGKFVKESDNIKEKVMKINTSESDELDYMNMASE